MTKFLLLSIITWCIGGFMYARDYNIGSDRTFGHIETENLISESVNLAPDVEQTISDVEAQMDAIKNSVLEQKRFVDRLDSATFISLPVGLSYSTDTLADPDYFIIIDQATIYPQHAEFSAFMSVKNPLDGNIIRFRANNIKFSFKSGLINGFKLELVSEQKTKLSESSYLYWLPGCFVDWDCNGFKSLGLKAKVELNENKYVRVDPQTGKEEGKVSTEFFISTSGLDDILLELTLDPFKIKGFDEAYFSFKKVTLDCSDTYNAPGFSLPANYPGGFTGDMAALWRGFYVQEALVVLDKKHKQRAGTPISFYAKNLYLDDFGLTGIMGVNDLLTYGQGKLGNWDMSISHFELEFFTGDFKRLEFDGGVIVQGIDNPLEYDAMCDTDGNYHFGVTPGKDLGFSIFSARVNLDASSKIYVGEEGGEFWAATDFNGGITFDCKKQGNKKIFNVPYVKFQGLRIATKKPVFDLDYLALTSESGEGLLNNFPINIDNVQFDKRQETRAAFSFDLLVNLINAEELGFIGKTHLNVVASIDESNWQYKGIELSSISIDVILESGFSLIGQIEIKEADPVYGDGFRGKVDATFAKKFQVGAVVVFGKVDGYRYFFADGFYTQNPGATAGPFLVNGFGGGVFYKMRQDTKGEGSEFGQSLSGINYVPDKKIFLGLKVGLKGSFAAPNIINAKLNFEISFTNSFGIAQIGFDGEASMLKPPAAISNAAMKALTKLAARGEVPKAEPTAMRVRVAMIMDFQNDIFHSEMEMFLNVRGVLKGAGENNRAGWGVVHIDPDKWYLHIGTPTDPVGVNFVGLMEVDSYFMAGHEIPDAMMMNQRVLEILDMDQSDFNGERKDGELIKGKGLAFGAHFKFDTGDLTFLIFYASFELGGGFDIMLLDYGPNVYCKGGSGSPGINGWYAKGQAYAYFAGKIGIKVKIFRRKRTFDIINLQAAAAIRMEGPNPTWMMGVVGGRYKILGGMIKGSCKFKMTLGKKCELRTMKDLSDLEIIADLTPANEDEEVDLFTMPQAVFNMPVDKVLVISEDPELTQTFKINLEEYAIYNEDGSKYPGEIEWNEDKTALAYRIHEIFYSNTKYKIVAKVSFDEKVDGEWRQYKGDDGKVYYETKESEFTTGALPDKIPDHAIAYSYPLDRMVNFYKQEYDKAYVGCNPGVAAFFENTEGYVQKAKWTKVNRESIYTELKYIKETRTIETNIPSSLIKDKIYHLELVHVPTSSSNNIDRNVTENAKSVIDNGEDDKTEIVTRKAEGVINDGEEKAFYGLHFRCSKYNKFLDKFIQNELNVNSLYNVSPGLNLLVSTINGNEMFDKYEICGNGNIEPLIKRTAILESADWYQSNIHSLIYEGYPFTPNTKITYRNVNELGVPPIKKIDLWQVDYNYLLTDEDIEIGTNKFKANKTHIVYSLPKTWASDFNHLRNKLANEIKNGITVDARIKSILYQYPVPQVSKGNYPIKVSYILPGINKITSERFINLKNEIYVEQVNLINK